MLLKTNVRMDNKHILVYNLTTHLDKHQNEQINEQHYRHYGVGNTTAVLYLYWKSDYNLPLYQPSFTPSSSLSLPLSAHFFM